MRNFYPKLRKFEQKLPIFCGRYRLVTDVTYELRMLRVKPADKPIRCQSADTCHGRLRDDLRILRMTYGRYGWVTLVSAHVGFLWRPHHPHINTRGSELASVAFHQVWELVPVSTPSFWTLVCIMSGRRSSRKTRKNPPVSEQPQQPPKAEEEGQEVEEEGPSLAELTVPPPLKGGRGKGRGKRARQGTRGSVEVKKTSLLLSFLVPFIVFSATILVPLSANLKMVIFGVKWVPQN